MIVEYHQFLATIVPGATVDIRGMELNNATLSLLYGLL